MNFTDEEVIHIFDVFRISAEQIIALMGFFLVGYIFERKRLVAKEATQTLSKLLTMLFCPALTLSNLAGNLTRSAIIENRGLLIVGSATILVSILVSRPLSRWIARGDKDLQGILDYNLIYGNYGYIGYPMIQGVFGDAALFRFLLYAIPLNVVCYTYGRMVVEGKKRLSLKFLLTPLSMSIWLGLLIGLLEIPLPTALMGFLSSAGSCTGPISMLITGMILSRVNLGQCLREPRNYLLAVLRLVVLALVAMAILYPLGVRGEELFFTGCFMCFPFGNNPIVFREAMGRDSQKAAGMTLVSYLFSLITIPIMFTLFRSLAGLS